MFGVGNRCIPLHMWRMQVFKLSVAVSLAYFAISGHTFSALDVFMHSNHIHGAAQLYA